jgi:hypothetical protein
MIIVKIISGVIQQAPLNRKWKYKLAALRGGPGRGDYFSLRNQ